MHGWLLVHCNQIQVYRKSYSFTIIIIQDWVKTFDFWQKCTLTGNWLPKQIPLHRQEIYGNERMHACMHTCTESKRRIREIQHSLWRGSFSVGFCMSFLWVHLVAQEDAFNLYLFLATGWLLCSLCTHKCTKLPLQVWGLIISMWRFYLDIIIMC